MDRDDVECLPISAKWLTGTDALRADFESAEPFPLLVLDDFLTPDLADGLLAEFPAIDAMPKSRDYVFSSKHELSSVEKAGAAGLRFHDMVTSPAFAAFLGSATGLNVFIDPMFFGGGFHQGGDGSFLDMHVDFNMHPMHSTWLRTFNLILYLNRDWQDDFGGELLVKNGPDGELRAIAPVFNRAVIMTTDERTFHGYRKMSLPPGVTRKSVATYAYQLVEEGAVKDRTSGWAPEEAGFAKRMFARYYDPLVRVKRKLFGSATAKNR